MRRNRGAGIRTRDLLLPKQARYRAAPHPELISNTASAGLHDSRREVVCKIVGDSVLHLRLGDQQTVRFPGVPIFRLT